MLCAESLILENIQQMIDHDGLEVVIRASRSGQRHHIHSLHSSLVGLIVIGLSLQQNLASGGKQ